jgi:DNA-binding XRE family transcriptional regulator
MTIFREQQEVNIMGKKYKPQKTYMDKLLEDKGFKKAFDREYSKLLVSEEIARVRKEAHLTQEGLARRIHSTKSAISRYESARYHGYSLSLLGKIACACGTGLEVKFVSKTAGI